MTSVQASVEIAAPPSTVWAVLVGFESYREWNPLIRRVDGRPEPGRRLRVVLTQTGLPPTLIAPEVTHVVAERELSWRSEAPIPGAFDASHSFLLEPVGDGSRTRFTQTETFGGVAGALVPCPLRDRIREGFRSMNGALRERVETGVGAGDGSD